MGVQSHLGEGNNRRVVSIRSIMFVALHDSRVRTRMLRIVRVM